jgi:peptidoglycan-associated lipoprotein
MKTQTLYVTMLAALVALVAAGCASTDLAQKPASATEPTAAAVTEQAPAPALVPLKQSGAPPPTPIDPLTDPNSTLTHRSVYFDYDRSVIHDSDVPVVEAHGRYLVDHPARTIRIEGNCDERGGREYNLALGQRRADAMRERLGLLGVSSDRVETISLGKEKPRNPGHDEAAWAENRRADIVYFSKG